MATHLPPTGSSWAVSDTVNKSVTFATGMLEAATSDNISPVALLCCEAFGSLLPLCTETRIKIEQLARRNHTSHVLNFIKASVGYKKGDSVEVLSRSDSGIRFLCLAATFCTLNHYDAANRLDALLQATQKERQIRPTIKQLQVMMGTLKTKMALSDYANTVAGWEIFARPGLIACGPEFAIKIAQVPSKESLQDLILAMNQLGRVGDITSIEVKLKPQHLPWTSAFIQWCLGLAPSVRTASAKYLLTQTDSQVTLTVTPQTRDLNSRKRPHDAADADLEVALRHTIRKFKEIVFREDFDSNKWAWRGLVNVETWIRYQFATLHDRFPEIRENERLLRAVGQALRFIVGTLPERLILCDDPRILMREAEQLIHVTSPKPFLAPPTRLKIARDLLHEYISLVEDRGKAETTFDPKKLAQLILGTCKCCTSRRERYIKEEMQRCRVCQLLEAIGKIGSAILIFTLFGLAPEAYPMVLAGLASDTAPLDPRIHSTRSWEVLFTRNFSQLIALGWHDLMCGNYKCLSCPPIAIFEDAANLMGQPRLGSSTIISSGPGQVLFPAFLEVQDFLEIGFMQLCAFPGKLLKNGMEFDMLVDALDDLMHDNSRLRVESDIIESEDDEIHETGDSDDCDYYRSARSTDDENLDRRVQIEPGSSKTSAGRGSRRHTISANHGRKSGERELVKERGMRIPTTALQRSTGVFASPCQTVPASFAATETQFITSSRSMEWKVAVENDILRGELFIAPATTPVRAWKLIEGLARSRLSPPCRHSVSRTAGELGYRFRLSKLPYLPQRPGYPRTLLKVGLSYAARLAVLEQQRYPATVVHVDGCIRCTLQLCLDWDCRLVIC